MNKLVLVLHKETNAQIWYDLGSYNSLERKKLHFLHAHAEPGLPQDGTARMSPEFDHLQ